MRDFADCFEDGNSMVLESPSLERDARSCHKARQSGTHLEPQPWRGRAEVPHAQASVACTVRWISNVKAEGDRTRPRSFEGVVTETRI